jgi:glycosyltransferase involved in cell wall biosynthesis
MTVRPSVVYVLPDKMGGVLTIVANLLEYRTADEFSYHALLTHNTLDGDARSGRQLAADSQHTVEFAMPVENMHAVVRRLRRAIGTGPGVLVCNDFVEMLMATLIDPGRTVIQILHGDYDYYYALASAHEPLVHAFVTYSRPVYETLVKRLPHRRDTIFYLPYGIPIPSMVRHPVPGPLRLIFLGRLTESKGVLSLPEIDRLLGLAGVPVTWTVVGSGPAGAALRSAWRDAAHVRWIEAAAPADVTALGADHDVFVLPTIAEGLSVATVEAMSVGLVPVVSDLPSMAELFDGERTGFRVPADSPIAFADAIAALSRDRDRLERMGNAARSLVIERFDVRARTSAYQALFAKWRELYRLRPVAQVKSYGSRLDQSWIPNPLVRLVRTAIRATR